jgi:hypothetical protein
MTVLDTPEQIEGFRLAVIIRALEVEVATGGQMRLTRNTPTVKSLRAEYGITARTKAEALEQMKRVYESHLLVTNA